MWHTLSVITLVRSCNLPQSTLTRHVWSSVFCVSDTPWYQWSPSGTMCAANSGLSSWLAFLCRCIHARTLGPFIPHMSHSQVAHLPVGEEKHRRNHTNSNSTQECECNTPPTWSHTKQNVVCCCKVCGVVLKSKADTWCLNHSEHFS